MSSRTRTAAVLSLGVLILSSGCDQFDDIMGRGNTAKVVESAEPSPTPSAPRGTNYFSSDVRGLPDVFRKEAGDDAKLLVLNIFPDYATLDVYDKEGDFNAKKYRATGSAAALDGAIKVPKTERDLERGVFSFGDVKLEVIPALIGDAATRAAVEDGQVTSVVVQRLIPFDEDVRIRLFVEGKGRAYVDYTADGAFIQTSQ